MERQKKIAIIGAEVEENLGVRYILSALEEHGHDCRFIRFNCDSTADTVVKETMQYSPDVVGLSMVFTLRARGFVKVAMMLRQAGYRGHITAGGHFASFNANDLLTDFKSFDSICHGEGEWILPQLAANLDKIEALSGVSYRSNGEIHFNSIEEQRRDLGCYPRPERAQNGHEFFGKPLRNILSGRGCYASCKFCSIHSWYRHIRLTHFRQRTVDDVLAEMKDCYHKLGTRIFNFHDDNFFLPTKQANKKRFEELSEGLHKLGLNDIALSIKARPDNLDDEIAALLNRLGVMRVFLGVENMSDSALKNLGRNMNTSDNQQALKILNDGGIQVAFNLLIFEPGTTMKDLELNLRFMEGHLENPYNFCRTEVYSGTPLELELREKRGLRGDYFGWDYVMEDPRAENFFNAVNTIFRERNFTPDGIQNTAMWVDYFYHVAQYFYPNRLTRTLRARSKNFVKQVNLDNYQRMAAIYDFVDSKSYEDPAKMHEFIAQETTSIMMADRLFKASAQQIISDLETSVGAAATKDLS